MPVKRIGVSARGRVQGVGYRAFCFEQAIRLELTGWVRNLPQGSVELEAQGARARVDRLVELLQRGPSLAHVRDFQLQSLPPKEGEATFEVLY